ncbi:hypothetical protein MMC31_001362 [Peltigera leucophlebia]|nr:hypothetical protein [Peltigera leucophlebia]
MISSNAGNLALITDDPTTKSKHIANNEHIDWGSRIPYLQGHRAAEYLKTHVFGDPSLSFQKIPGWMQAFEGTYIGSRCRTAHTKYEIDPITHQFHRAGVLPTATQEAYSHCRNIGYGWDAHERSISHDHTGIGNLGRQQPDSPSFLGYCTYGRLRELEMVLMKSCKIHSFG